MKTHPTRVDSDNRIATILIEPALSGRTPARNCQGITGRTRDSPIKHAQSNFISSVGPVVGYGRAEVSFSTVFDLFNQPDNCAGFFQSFVFYRIVRHFST